MKYLLFIWLILTCIGLQAQSVNFQVVKDQYEKLDTACYLNNIKVIIIDRKDDYTTMYYNEIKSKFEKDNLIFVLKIDIDTSKIFTNNYIKIDTCKFKYDMYFFNKKFYRTKSLFIECSDGKYDVEFTEVYRTFNYDYAKKLKYAYRKIMKMHPTYLLDCICLPNTILYAKNEKIYVFRVMQSEIYELDKYINNFRDSKYFYYW